MSKKNKNKHKKPVEVNEAKGVQEAVAPEAVETETVEETEETNTPEEGVTSEEAEQTEEATPEENKEDTSNDSEPEDFGLEEDVKPSVDLSKEMAPTIPATPDSTEETLVLKTDAAVEPAKKDVTKKVAPKKRAAKKSILKLDISLLSKKLEVKFPGIELNTDGEKILINLEGLKVNTARLAITNEINSLILANQEVKFNQ